MSLLDEVLKQYNALPKEKQKELLAASEKLKQSMGVSKWIPLPGPQTQAFLSKADVLLYGGQAGGGKSALEVGLAQQHQKTLIVRRETTQTDGLIAEAKKIYIDCKFNGQDSEFTKDDWSLKIGGMKDPDDWMKYAGRERDLICFDEGLEFLKNQVISMLAWLRGPEGQRCRMVIGSNPPRSSDGFWCFELFGPWLDKAFPNPARDGELRWAVIIDGIPKWVDGPEKVEVDGILYKPLSFTFISASLKDNPYRDTDEYRARLNSLHKTLRAQLLHGDFTAGLEDNAYQVIPTSWVLEAIERWKPHPPKGIPMCAIGVDVAQGGDDKTVLAPRYDGYYAKLITVPGKQTPTGRDISGLVIAHRRDGALPVIDMGGGYGGAAFEHLTENNIECKAFKGAQASTGRTRDGQLKFSNKRTEAYWRFREALDPSQREGSRIALPDDKELISDLTSPTFKDTPEGIEIEPKEKLIKRIGRSPDKGDAVVMAWMYGDKMESNFNEWEPEMTRISRPPQVVMGREHVRTYAGTR
jgi:hypothetical protein